MTTRKFKLLYFRNETCYGNGNLYKHSHFFIFNLVYIRIRKTSLFWLYNLMTSLWKPSILKRQNARTGLGPINHFLRFLLCYSGQNRKRRKRKTLTTSRCFTDHPLTTFETRRQLEPKCVSQMLLGLLAWKRRLAISQILITVPEFFAKVYSTQFLFRFQRRRTLKL